MDLSWSPYNERCVVPVQKPNLKEEKRESSLASQRRDFGNSVTMSSKCDEKMEAEWSASLNAVASAATPEWVLDSFEKLQEPPIGGTLASKDAQNTYFKYLRQPPMEMGTWVEEILRRMPVKSLLRFRCVSKSWRSLISSPEFIKSHWDFWISRGERLMFQEAASPFEFRTCLLHQLPLRVDIVLFPGGKNSGDKKIVGVCNGVICFLVTSYDPPSLILWNPSTRKTKLLPLGPYLNIRVYGFGYEESTSNFKVLGFQRDCWKIKMHLYSCRANSWREIVPPFTYFSDFSQNYGVFVGGAIHWLGSFIWDTTKQESKGIVAFNLAKKNWSYVDGPLGEDYAKKYLYNMHLGVLNGYLCVCVCLDDCLETWILRQVWTKLPSIQYGPYISRSEMRLSLLNKENIMMLWFATKKQWGQCLWLSETWFSDIPGRQFAVYTESLMPP